jgi:hypothetical protein
VSRLVPATLCLAALACGATVALAGGPSHESTVRILDDASGSPPPMARSSCQGDRSPVFHHDGP